MKRAFRNYFFLTFISIIFLFNLLLAYLILQVFEFSFLNRDLTKFVGLSNWISLFTQPLFWASLTYTLIYVCGVVFLEFIVGLGLALFTVEESKKNKFLRVLILLPQLGMPSVVAVTWGIMYHPDIGFINHVIEFFGGQRIAFLALSEYSLLSIMFTDFWASMPFMYLILLAGLKALPKAPLEAAAIDGASNFQRLKYVILPIMRPTFAVALLVKLTDTLKVFTYPWIMTRGGPGTSSMVLSIYAYKEAFQSFNYGFASCISSSSILISFVFAILLYKITR